jgi:outer membrane protein OmpA-like peptidoglycan-associated protein
MRPFLFLLIIAFAAPQAADAQSVLKRIKQSAKQKISDRKAQTKDNIVNAAGEPVDSALVKAGEPVDSAVSKSASGVAAAVAKGADKGKAALGIESASYRIAEALKEGRAVLDEIRFQPGTAMFDPSSESTLIALRDALLSVEGTFLIEAHVAPNSATDAAALQDLASQRASMVTEWLVMSGVEPARLLALGRSGGEERVEVVAVR